MLNNVKGKGILIHHWDTDGICSAKLVLEKLGDNIKANKTPILGNYFLTREEIEECKAFDFVIIVDMNLPRENIMQLSENSKVMIFDHHLGPEIKEVFHHNPIIKGENPDDYPSASWIVNDYLKNEVNLFSILGVVGDHEQKIKNNPNFWKIITDFCDKNNLTFDDLHKMVYLLDSNYKMGEKKAVEKAPHTLLKLKGPRDILENPEWNKNYTLIENELNKQLTNNNEANGNIILKKMNTNFNIISTVTRKLAWKTQKNTIVVNTGFFDDLDQIYVRTNNENMEPMIQRGKQLGFKCGGKKEVLGAIIPKEKTDSFVNEIIDYLK
jgi:single-stranded DNA-specific DHH superfamily exonuclease